MPTDVTESVLAIQKDYGQLQVEAAINNVTEKLQLSSGELQWRTKQLAQDRYVTTRWQVSPTQADQASRHMLALISLRFHSNLMVAKRCNDDFGDDSPFKDDPLLKAHPERANMEFFQEALDRAMETRPTTRSPKPKAEPPKPAKPAPRENTDRPGEGYVKGPSSPGVKEQYTAWIDAYQAWRDAGDTEALLPEYPQIVYEYITRQAKVNPEFEELRKHAQGFIHARNKQLAELEEQQDGQDQHDEQEEHQAQGGAEPTTKV
jgi:hypothetical protein